MVEDKGNIKEGQKDLFLQELRALLIVKRHSNKLEVVSDGPLSFPKVDHLRFNSLCSSERRHKRRPQLSQFSRKKFNKKWNKRQMSSQLRETSKIFKLKSKKKKRKGKSKSAKNSSRC